MNRTPSGIRLAHVEARLDDVERNHAATQRERFQRDLDASTARIDALFDRFVSEYKRWTLVFGATFVGLALLDRILK